MPHLCHFSVLGIFQNTSRLLTNIKPGTLRLQRNLALSMNLSQDSDLMATMALGYEKVYERYF